MILITGVMAQNLDRVKSIVLYITTERHNAEVFDTYTALLPSIVLILVGRY
jgi:hypothetical protein